MHHKLSDCFYSFSFSSVCFGGLRAQDDIIDLTTSLKTNVSMFWPAFPNGYERVEVVKELEGPIV